MDQSNFNFNASAVQQYSREIRLLLEPLARKQHITVFDVGANIGYWSRALISAWRRPITLTMVEPSRVNAAELETLARRLTARMSDLDATVLRLAAGDSPGEAVLSGDRPGSPLASLTSRGDIPLNHSELVQCETLDNMLNKSSIHFVDILKIDTEGFELATLRGAYKSFESGLVEYVFFEFSQANVYTRVFFNDIWSFLRPFGYHFYYLEPDLQLFRPVLHYDGEWEKFWGTSYFLARRGFRSDDPDILTVRAALSADQATGEVEVLGLVALDHLYRFDARRCQPGAGWRQAGSGWTAHAGKSDSLKVEVPSRGLLSLRLMAGPAKGKTVVKIDRTRIVLKLGTRDSFPVDLFIDRDLGTVSCSAPWVLGTVTQKETGRPQAGRPSSMDTGSFGNTPDATTRGP